MLQGQASTWASVQEYHRLAVRITALFPIEGMDIIYRQHSGAVGFDRWKQEIFSGLCCHGNKE
jgi:hypothetical protein